MLFDAPPADSYQEGHLLHWFLRGGLFGILLLGSGMLLPSRWERLYHLLCPATDSSIASNLGVTLSSTSAAIWLVFILVSQFVMYGAIAFGVGYVLRMMRNRMRNRVTQ
jgi:hypothetical protein